MTRVKEIDVGVYVQIKHSITIGGKTYPVGSRGKVRRQEFNWCEIEMGDGNKAMVPKEDLLVCEDTTL